MSSDAIAALLAAGVAQSTDDTLFKQLPNYPVTNPKISESYTNYPFYGSAYYQCQDGSYAAYSYSNCPTAQQDTCDSQAKFEADTINFLRTINGQSPITTIDTSSTATRGYCSLASANYTAIRAWYPATFIKSVDPVTSLQSTTVIGLQNYDCNPTCGDGGAAAPAHGSVLSVAGVLTLVAATVIAVAATNRRD